MILDMEMDAIRRDPLVAELLKPGNGLFAVCNPSLRIVAMSDAFLHLAGPDRGKTAGLSLGEFVHCIHCAGTRDGCGISPRCPSCIWYAAIRDACSGNATRSGNCRLTVLRDKGRAELRFRFRCIPATVEKLPFILCFLDKISMFSSTREN